MENAEIIKLLSEYDKLNMDEKEMFLALVSQIAEKEEIIKLLSQFDDHKLCPRCKHEKIIKWGYESGIARYRCKGCKRTFNSLTKTPFAKLKKKEKWLSYSKFMLEGKSVRKAANELSINKNTSFKWRHRFLNLVSRLKGTWLGGVVEIDDFFLRKSEKGSKNLKRKPRKRAGKGKNKSEFIKVVVALDRNGISSDIPMEKINDLKLSYELSHRILPDAVLCSDGAKAYKSMAKHLNLTHRQLNIKKGVRVLEKAFHIQTVNSYHNNFKCWIFRFRGIATKYLNNYLGWFRWMAMNKKHCIKQAWFFSALKGIAPNEKQRIIRT